MPAQTPADGRSASDDGALAEQLANPPTGLSDAGTALWTSIAGTWVLRADERQVLADAAREADLIARLSAALASSPLTVLGSQGQEVASPFVSELRQHRNCLAALLRQLKLPDEDTEADAGLTQAQKSAAARAAARARWDRRSGSA